MRPDGPSRSVALGLNRSGSTSPTSSCIEPASSPGRGPYRSCAETWRSFRSGTRASTSRSAIGALSLSPTRPDRFPSALGCFGPAVASSSPPRARSFRSPTMPIGANRADASSGPTSTLGRWSGAVRPSFSGRTPAGSSSSDAAGSTSRGWKRPVLGADSVPGISRPAMTAGLDPGRWSASGASGALGREGEGSPLELEPRVNDPSCARPGPPYARGRGSIRRTTRPPTGGSGPESKSTRAIAPRPRRSARAG